MRRKIGRLQICVFVSSRLFAIGASQTFADTMQWKGTVDSDWTNANNWKTTSAPTSDPSLTPPTSATRVEITNTPAPPFPAIVPNGTLDMAELRIGRGGGPGTLTVSGGTLNSLSNKLRLGDGLNAADGTLIQNGGAIVVNSGIEVGIGGHGYYEMNGGSLTVNGSSNDIRIDEGTSGNTVHGSIFTLNNGN